ncbi:MAG: M23 family metallopeptidase [Ruminococcaceae bacterium]|nr:M23 family metallopeptidase [Oscillospiraceae bacterium]
MTNCKKISIWRILGALMVAIIALSLLSIPASAASTSAFSQINSSKIMKVYTIKTSNTVCYTSNMLKTRGSVTYGASKTAYISGSDELYVNKIGKNVDGKYYAYVSYPIGSKRAMAYIPLSAITSNNAKHTKTTATGTVYTSKRAGASATKTTYVEKGDTVYLISTSGDYCQIMYSVSGGWRLAWVSKTNYNKYCNGTNSGNSSNTNNSTSVSFRLPMNNPTTSYTTWGKAVNYMPTNRRYHIGVDYGYRNDKNIYSITSGTVKSVGYNGANGNYAIIQHTISGKTVYSFYAHLNSYCVKAGDKVSAGSKIGVIGKSGSSANGTVHLHFAITDKLWSNGAYYGYASAFSGNKTTYSGVTYYNPIYVISNGKLPS